VAAPQSVSPTNMNKTLVVLVASAMCGALAGCNSGGDSPAETAKFKSQLEQKKPDLSKIPESQKKLVEGFMKQAGSRPPSADAVGTKRQ